MPPPTMSLYANQFYGGQEAYPRPDMMTAQAMAVRLQGQYTGPYGAVHAQGMGIDSDASNGANGPSANNRKLGLYKTELCRSWEEKGTCRYGAKCQFAHGEDELRKVSRHPKVNRSMSNCQLDVDEIDYPSIRRKYAGYAYFLLHLLMSDVLADFLGFRFMPIWQKMLFHSH